MKILLIGHSGQLGSCLVSIDSQHEWITPDRTQLDLTDLTAFATILNTHKPDVVINTAAFHNVPLCETEPQQAFCVNVIAVERLARVCKEAKCRFVTYSTDYVFEGQSTVPYTEDDAVKPVQMYGVTRAAGEWAVMNVAADNSAIIRTCGLYGMLGASSKGGNFVDNRVKDAKSSPRIEMGCDQTISPTSAVSVARATLELIEKPTWNPGIYHFVNEGHCTWYEFTCEIYRQLGIEVEVVPIDRKGFSGDMRRPLYSVLKNIKGKALGIQLPHWKVALREYLETKYGSTTPIF